MRPSWPTRAVRDALIGERGRFVLEQRKRLTVPQVQSADLYIHIPFCRSLCPYCPYNRVRYEAKLANDYVAALLAEIEAYRRRLGRIEVGSIYIGGGTPTTVLDGLDEIITRVRRRFDHTGTIGIETTPEDLDNATIERLRAVGTDLLSVGIQSFDDRYLKLMGRPYRADILAPAIRRAMRAGFTAVNLDLMFALPGQSVDEALADLRMALDLGAEQVTLYPLFTFPYSSVGKHRELQRVAFPSLASRRRMYRALHDEALAQGFERVSVWGFKKRDTTKFSSVTRDNYIGLGAGAATCLPRTFYFNTFSIPEYIKACAAARLPVSLQMDMTTSMTRFYWLYWRLYETRISMTAFADRFSDDARIAALLWLATHLRLVSDTGGTLELTERGSFWIHLLQNYYVLNYINTVWTQSMQTAWPRRIEL